jgi:hypothetical protein
MFDSEQVAPSTEHSPERIFSANRWVAFLRWFGWQLAVKSTIAGRANRRNDLPEWRAAMSFLRDFKIAVRSLWRVRALWITVAITLALGIGANAAIFSVVRSVLLRPLANRDEERLLYLRQSAPGINVDNAGFSIPEIDDLGSGLKTITNLGTFSELDFTIVGLGRPRSCSFEECSWWDMLRTSVVSSSS